MMEPSWPPRRGPQIENLIQRQEHLQLMIDSHWRWKRETTNPGLKTIHGALIESLQKVMEQYRILLNELEDRG